MDLNIFHHGDKNVTPATDAPKENPIQEFISVLDFIGTEIEKVLTFAVKYEVPEEALIAVLFPAAAPEAAAVLAAVNLIQKSVLEMKQKGAAMNPPLTPAKMLADEVELCFAPVEALLATVGIKITESELIKKIEIVVAVLDGQLAPASA